LDRIIETPEIDFRRRLNLDLKSKTLMSNGEWLVPEHERPTLAVPPTEGRATWWDLRFIAWKAATMSRHNSPNSASNLL